MSYLLNGGGGACGLTVGKRVRIVNVTTSLRVRSCAGLSCSQIGSRTNGVTGVIELGPQYVDGYTWWKIRWEDDNLVGWSAEGQSGVCWLALAPPAALSITTTAPTASEWGAVAGEFRVSRAGDTAGNLTVYYTVQGSASNGMDYALLPGSVTIAAGSSSQSIGVMPIADDLAEGDESVTVSLQAAPGYALGTPSSATLTIRDRPADGWKHQYFGGNANNPVIAGDAADPDGDGIPNLMEYALGLNPDLASVVGLPACSIEDGLLTLTYTRLRPPPADIDYAGQASEDLSAWCGSSCTMVQVSDNGNDTETVKVQKVAPASMTSRGFLRLRVTRK